MKELNQRKEAEAELSLADQVAQMKPLFATSEEALKYYEAKLDDLSNKDGRSIKTMLTQFETSAIQDDVCDEAMRLSKTISRLKRKQNG